jgi:hypothetical protein
MSIEMDENGINKVRVYKRKPESTSYEKLRFNSWAGMDMTAMKTNKENIWDNKNDEYKCGRMGQVWKR